MNDAERIARVRESLKRTNVDAFVCSLPSNILMLTGYYPVVGTSVGIMTRDGVPTILCPEDEAEIARRSTSCETVTFQPGSLTKLGRALDSIQPKIREIFSREGLKRKRVGCEFGPYFQPASYASLHLYVTALKETVRDAGSQPVAFDEEIARLRATKTALELDRIRRSCVVASKGFADAKDHLAPANSEIRVAAGFRSAIETAAVDGKLPRTEAFVFCMSGENSLDANAAFQRSSVRELQRGDLAVVHCNSHSGGYFTDITRTYCLKPLSDEQHKMYEAVLDARAAAISEIGPGIKAADVDKAAREILTIRGYGKDFKHGTGHEVGFAAIDHNAPPRLHPASNDVLKTGMTFNVEPALYIRPASGLRHCDMVAVTERGCEVLTTFHGSIKELIVETEQTASKAEEFRSEASGR